MTFHNKTTVIRFAGDSGDGVQLIGQLLANSHGDSGGSFSTLPDFPAEIRAPAGTQYGVSAFQLQLSSGPVFTPGDTIDVLVAFNPAALFVNLSRIKPSTLLIIDRSKFAKKHWLRAGLNDNPLDDQRLNQVKVFDINISELNTNAVQQCSLNKKQSSQCKNFWVLGLIIWLFGHDKKTVLDEIKHKFKSKPIFNKANSATLNAGYYFGETMELSFTAPTQKTTATFNPTGLYQSITGIKALTFGIITALEKANLHGLFCSYPITPASGLMHEINRIQHQGISTFQAEDEIAAIGSAIGASFAGMLGITATSGPGIALKSELIGLSISAELPLLIINSQRGGPSTGLPTKTEQSDLFQAMYGRHGDSGIPIIAAHSPSHCFQAAIDAMTIALRHMTPVILLTDAFINNASELWPLPNFDKIPVIKHYQRSDKQWNDLPAFSGSLAFERDPKTHARNWIVPGQPNGMHRIGGLETDLNSGNISYDAENHQLMTQLRSLKVKTVNQFNKAIEFNQGHSYGHICLLGWGSTYGVLSETCLILSNALEPHISSDKVNRRNENELIEKLAFYSISHLHIDQINPLPNNIQKLLKPFDLILVFEMNNGQLATILKAELISHIVSVKKVSGQPFTVTEILEAINKHV